MAKANPTEDLKDDELVEVGLPSGGNFFVDKREKKYFGERVKRYLKDNHFTNVADLASLDQVLVMELLLWRWGIWVSQQRNYWGEPIDEGTYGRQMKDLSAELRQLKAALGIDKVSRDKQKGEEAVDKYLENLRIRAREFGINRENQLAKALELLNELFSLVTLHFNTDLEEQRELRISANDVMEWIRDTAEPEYRAIDDHFRKNKQRMWIREM